jgi:hypothetical protein
MPVQDYVTVSHVPHKVVTPVRTALGVHLGSVEIGSEIEAVRDL